MICLFDTELAKTVGDRESIMLVNIAYWVNHNRQNGQNERDGHYWTYNSLKAYGEQFPCWSNWQIRNILKSLEDNGCIMSRGDLNQSSHDRTKWYTLTDKGEMLTKKFSVGNCNMHLRKTTNGFVADHKSTIKSKEYQRNTTSGGMEEPTELTQSSKFMKWYADNINPSFGPRLAEMVSDLEQHYGGDACIKAGDIALKNNKRSLSYIEGILKRWETEGYSDHAPRSEPRRAGQQSAQELYEETMAKMEARGLV